MLVQKLATAFYARTTKMLPTLANKILPGSMFYSLNAVQNNLINVS
jgi:hypothetical protein